MKRLIASVLMLVTAALLRGAAPESVRLNGVEVHPTRLLARMSVQAGGAAANLDAQQLRAMGSEQVTALANGWVVIDLNSGLSSLAMAPATADDTKPEVLAKRLAQRMVELRKSGLYDFVEPDYIVKAFNVPNDPRFTDGTLWGLRNTGQSGGVAGADIDAVRAWDLTTGSTNVVVAVIDTGIRYTHQDLSSQMWRNPGEIPGNGIDDDNDGYVDNVFGINAINNSGDPMDDHDHGTHVAGTIGAAGNDGVGIVGVAWNVRLMACKFLSSSGSGTTSDAVRCINFATSKGAKILSNSWGGGGYSQALFDAIDNARAQGVLFVAAAGNSTSNNDLVPSYPASYPIANIIAVAAIDRSDNLASFSSYGARTVHLGAPGVAVYSSTRASDSSYATFNGTSMATPHVSGAAALVLARYPDISLAHLMERLVSTTTPTPALAGRTISGGRLNVYNALNTSPDGTLEIAVTPANSTPLAAGRVQSFFVRVSDLLGVADATVTASGPGLPSVTFRNDGQAPDLVSGDANYSASIAIPSGVSSITLTIAASAPGKTGVSQTLTYPVVVTPANDNFADRIALSGNAVGTTGNNVSASRETGEPYHAGYAGGKSVWWTWTPAASGVVTMHTTGSSFNTLLGVYTGSVLNTLSSVASNAAGSSSSVTFNVIGGTPYQIAVDGYNAASGTIALNINWTPPPPPPANDMFADRIVITGSSASVTGTNVNATLETGEPRHYGTGGKSVWWRWTAPTSGLVTIKTDGSNYDTVLAVYTGTAVSALTLVAQDDDAGEGLASLVSFSATAGTTYQIAVDGFAAQSGTIALNVELAVPPANDAFANRATLSGTSGTATGNNTAASREAGEPLHAGNTGGRSVWWTWTAPSTGTATITTTGSAFNTLLAVYTGSTLSALTPITANDNDPQGGVTSRVMFNTVAGTTYQIAVDGYSDGWTVSSGAITLAFSLGALVPPPANDLFASRTTITGGSATVTGSNFAATKEAGEPNHAGNSGGASVWWSWTAPTNGQATIKTENSNFDTLLAIYTGTSVNALTLVTSNDNYIGTTSLVTFTVTAGTTYQIAVDGFYGATGNISLNVSLPTPPANDLFANRITLSGSTVTTTGSNTASSAEPGEPYLGGRSVWWTWTAPASGELVVTTVGSNYDSYLGAYTGSTVSGLTQLAFDDDSGGGLTSRIAIDVTAGSTYQLGVGGYGGSMGNITLNLALSGPVAPTILSPPASQSANLGGSATFTVTVRGTPPLTYQWRKNGSPIGGATNATLTISNIQLSDGGTYSVVVSNAQGSATSSAATLTVIAPPANDRFADAIALTGNNPTATGVNTYASKETGEPDHAGNYGGHSLWWRWTAPASGVVSIDTAESTIPTLLAVYTGTAVNALTLVAADTASWSTYPYQTSTVAFQVTSGTTYYIAVDGAYYSTGAVSLRLAFPSTAVAPLIITQPQSRAVSLGSSTYFEVVVSGTAPLTFQWRRGGTAIPGATQRTFAINAVQAGDAGDYSVVVTNLAGSVTSTNATLLIASGAPGNDLFDNRFTLTGADVSTVGYNFFSTAESGEPTWGQRSVWWTWTAPFTGRAVFNTIGSSFDTLLGVYTGSAVNALTTLGFDDDSGGNLASLISLNVTAGTVYQISVDGYSGSTGSIVLNVSGPPTIQTQPVSRSAAPGSSTTFTVVASGAPRLVYQWQKDGTAINGAINASYRIDSVTAAHAGNYTVVIANGAGNVTSSPAALSVSVAPVITTPPASQSADVGATVAFTVVASGGAPLSYQWRRNGAPLATGTAATLTLTSVQTSDAGNYDVVVTNAQGTVTSPTATLTVRTPPVIVSPPLSRTAVAGASVSFSVTAVGTPAPTYQWRKGTAPIDGATSPSYTIDSVTTADAGSYSVVVTNTFGSTTSAAATLTVIVTPAITTHPASQTVNAGANVTFQVAATGTPTLLYQWRKNGAPITGATAVSLEVTNVQPTDAGTYSVSVSNSAGSVVSNGATLTVNVPSNAPVITTQPVNRSAQAGETVTFAVVASGAPTLTYQWRRDGTPIGGATLPSLQLTNVQTGDIGAYSVVVTNGMGSVTSRDALLSVVPAGFTVSHTVVGAGYLPGVTAQIRTTITYTGSPTALGYQVLLPAGWSYVSGGGAEGQVKPALGTVDLLEWAWTSLPPSPIIFTYTLSVPPTASGAAEIAGLATSRPGPVQILAQPDPLVLNRASTHSGDTDRDFRLSLLELTRMIELYNTRNGLSRTGCYAPAGSASEDGFTPEPSRSGSAVVTLPRHHSADSNRDGRLSLLELTRVIELYNYRNGSSRTGEYHVQPSSEDGFAPGP